MISLEPEQLSLKLPMPNREAHMEAVLREIIAISERCRGERTFALSPLAGYDWVLPEQLARKGLEEFI